MEVYLDEFALNDNIMLFMDESIEGVAGLPNIRSASGQNVGRDGGWVSRQLYDARYISFQGRIFNGDPLQVEVKRRELATVLRRKILTLKIVTYGGQEFTTQVNVMSGQMPITWELNVVKWKIDLVASDPLFYDNSAGELEATITKPIPGGFDIPFDIPLDIGTGSVPIVVNNAGNETVYPRIEITTKATNPEIINQTNNQSMKVQVSVLGTGDKLVIDMKNQTITYNGLNVYGYKTDGSSFCGIDPGNNTLLINTDIAGETSAADVFYQSGFIGI